MTQGVGVTVRQDVLGDPTAKCLAEISDLIGSKLAEPAPHAPPRDAWNSQPEAELFDEEVVIKEVLDALPNGTAIAFSAHQLEVLFSGGRPVLADTKTAATIIERLAHPCGCAFALHGDTGTFTKNLIDTAASAQMNIPRSPIQIGFEEEKRDKMFGKSNGSSHEEDKLLSPVQQLQDLAPAHLAASEPAANCSISPGMTIVGRIPSEGTVNVFGRVEGELNASTVRISDDAQVEGTLAAQDLTIGARYVQYEPGEFPGVYSVGSQHRSAKRISRGSLQIAILALTVGTITGAGAMFAWVGHPSHQYTASLTASTPAIIIQLAANLPTPEPASGGRRKVSDETPEHAAPPWSVPRDAYASPPMNNSSSQISGAPDDLGQITNRTSALDMPSSLADAANEEDARQTGRKTSRYISTHRFTHWQHRYRYAFHRYAFWHRYRYAFRSLRKGWI